MSRIMLSVFVLATLLFPAMSVFPEDLEAERSEFEEHKYVWIQDMRKTISCIQEAKDWQQWEHCHEEAEIRSKERRLQELQKEQKRIQQEINKMRNKE